MENETIFKVHLYPLNEGQELNYHEFFQGTFLQLEVRMWEMIRGLESTLPNGTFTVKIGNMACTDEWIFDKGAYFDKNCNIINLKFLKVKWLTNASIQRI